TFPYTTLRQSRPRGAGVPELSKLATKYPALVIARSNPAVQRSTTVCEAGSEYTFTISGYVFDGSKFGGLISHASTITPSPASTFINFTGPPENAFTFSAIAELSAVFRATLKSGKCTTSEVGGTSN